jgi:F-type H+-transporting ATPase subunit gamma
MSDTLESLRRTIDGAKDLGSVVRTMKAMAASSVGEYEQSVRALADYDRTLRLGLAACFRRFAPTALEPRATRRTIRETVAVVFGSDQGLVGQFNEVMAEFVSTRLGALPGRKKIWAVGERVRSRLDELALPSAGLFRLPTSVTAITPLVGQLLAEIETRQAAGDVDQVLVFHHRPTAGAAYEPARQRVLPFDADWLRELTTVPWPTRLMPEVMNAGNGTVRALVREYLFVSLFKACAESLASENASRLAAMQRAEKNIGERLENLTRAFHRLRQSAIDEELFDVVSGFEALKD